MSQRPLSPELMDRREALLRIGTTMGCAMIGSSALLSGCATTDARPVSELFSPADIGYLDTIADTILPDTGTPGARAAGVGAFMAVMVADTYTADERHVFLDGMAAIDDLSRSEFGLGFETASATQRTRLLERLDREQLDYMNSRQPDMAVHYFRMVKELTLQGYFTSEIGYTQAMRYAETPGRWEPCVPYEDGDRAWADHA